MHKNTIVFFLVSILFFSTTIQTLANSLALPEETLKHDQQILKITRQSLDHIIQYMQTEPELFPPEKLDEKRLLNREQRAAILTTWQIFLQHIYTLDVLGQKYNLYYQQLDEYKSENKSENNAENKARHTAFKMAYGAFLTQYRYALDFITICENDPTLHIVLNEADSEHALNAGLYKDIKFRFLNVLRGIEFARLEVVYQFYLDAPSLSDTGEEQSSLETAIAKDSHAIWQAGKGSGPEQTAKNAMTIVKDTFFTTWFPLQKEVSQWMGDTKVFRQSKNLISSQQINDLQKKLQPGDILIERREWYLSNLGLPGYWSHAALYIGTAEERKAFFAGSEIQTWLAQHYPDYQAKDVNELLKQRYPEAYQISLTKQEDDHLPRVIEAISEGVSFTTLEHSAGADSIAVLRPRLDKTVKAEAIVRAFAYSGRPYDFNFDFVTDDALVCTEVIYKIYEPTSTQAGLKLPVSEILGRKAITANDIIELFAAEFEPGQQQFEFIIFLDGYERENKAIESDMESLRASWLRPNWHILVQDAPLENQ